jgi:hypothetical protein
MNYTEPHIPTPEDIIPKMLTLASVMPDGTVFDLGSGDGRMLMIAAREVQWLAVAYQGKLSEVNRLQRELFASMPRRPDYTPFGQVSQDLDGAPSKISELESAHSSEEESCKKLEAGIAILKTQIQAMKEALYASRR